MKRVITNQEHARVLAQSIDVPQQRPEVALPLNEVGISGKTVWVRLPQGRLPFEARIVVNLGAEARGIHMSRMEDAITNLAAEQFQDLRDYGINLGRSILSGQNAERAQVRLAGKIPVQRQAPVSGRISLDSVEISAEILCRNLDGQLASEALISAGVHHLTACPCTQVYNEVLFQADGRECPMPTHSQRSHTRITVTAAEHVPTFEQLLDILDTALHVTQDLLKRPDEAEIVLRAHRQPQFAEDAVRETARAAAQALKSLLPPAAKIVIESLSFESIHSHDVTCRLDTTLGEILVWCAD